MFDISNLSILGHILVRDAVTKEVLEDKDNAIHFGNMASTIAGALVGNTDSHIVYMAFGNGGSIVSGPSITYKPPKVSTVVNQNASMYNTTYIKQMTNDNSGTVDLNNHVTVPVQPSTNYRDIVATVLLPMGASGPTPQQPIDNAVSSSEPFVFDEISLYAGPLNALGGSTETSDIVTSIPSFVNNSGTLLLTHVIFHPVQKSQNRSLEIVYTVRIQMGTN